MHGLKRRVILDINIRRNKKNGNNDQINQKDVINPSNIWDILQEM